MGRGVGGTGRSTQRGNHNQDILNRKKLFSIKGKKLIPINLGKCPLLHISTEFRYAYDYKQRTEDPDCICKNPASVK